MSFDERAKIWDTDDRIKRAKEFAEEMIKNLPLKKEFSIMEFGCGTGLISFNFHKNFEKLTLVDSSRGMIEVVEEKIKSLDVKNMIPYFLDLTKEDKLTEKFDFIYNSMVMHHIENTEEILRKFYSLLNHDGYISLVDLDKEDGSFHSIEHGFDGHKGFDKEYLCDLLRTIGFEILESKSFYTIRKNEKEYTLFVIKAKKV